MSEKTNELYRLAFEHYKKAISLMRIKESERQSHLVKIQHETNLCNILLHMLHDQGEIEVLSSLLPDPKSKEYDQFKSYGLPRIQPVLDCLGEMYFPKFRKDELKREVPKPLPVMPPCFSIPGYVTE